MSVNNPFYHRCIYLDSKFIDHGISSYCKYICMKFNMVLSVGHIRTMCCINNSPCQKKNCIYFKDKSGSEQVTLFKDVV